MHQVTSRKPEVVHVIAYYPPHLGGMENCAAHLAEGCAERGYHVSVYTSDRGYSRQTAMRSKARVHYLKAWEWAHTPIIFTLLLHLLALPRRTLIHLHVSQAFAPEVVYLASKLRGIPYVAHMHLDVDPSGPFGFLLEPYKRVFLKRVLHAAAKVICLSEPQQQLIAMKYHLLPEALVVIPNGVADEYFVGAEGVDNAVPRLLFVGRLAPQKNLSLFVKAVAQMRERVCVDIVGEGEERASLEALIEQYHLHHVVLHGKQTGADLLAFYRSADIFVLPSLKEGVSLAMLEALAAGLPVVASDQPEIRQFLGECGLLIENPTASAYAQALDLLVRDKERRKHLSERAVQKARSYSWQTILAAIDHVYEELAHEYQ